MIMIVDLFNEFSLVIISRAWTLNMNEQHIPLQPYITSKTAEGG